MERSQILYFKTQIDKKKSKIVKLVGICFIGVNPTGSNDNRVRSLAKYLKNIKPKNNIRKKNVQK